MAEARRERKPTAEQQMETLVQRGKDPRGYLTYEEMNDSLTDDMVSPGERPDRIS